MYEVFLNDRSIQIVAARELTISKSALINPWPSHPDKLDEWLKSIESGEDPEHVVELENPKWYFENVFCPFFIVIEAAGGVVFRNNCALFIYRNSRWDLPKGKIDEGESPVEAALREVQEECGIRNLSIKKELPSSYHLYKSPYAENMGDWILKKTYWFEMSYHGAFDGLPQEEEDITKVEWVEKQRLQKIYDLTYANLRPVLSPYLY